MNPTFLDTFLPASTQSSAQAGTGMLKGMNEAPFLAEELMKSQLGRELLKLQMEQKRQSFPMDIQEQQAKIARERAQTEELTQRGKFYGAQAGAWQGGGMGPARNVKEQAERLMSIGDFENPIVMNYLRGLGAQSGGKEGGKLGAINSDPLLGLKNPNVGYASGVLGQDVTQTQTTPKDFARVTTQKQQDKLDVAKATAENKPLSLAERKEVGQEVILGDTIKALKANFNPSFIGPVMGRKSQLSVMSGVGATPQLADFAVQMANLNNVFIKSRSGTAVSGNEAVRMDREFPGWTDPPQVFFSKMNQTEKNILAMQDAIAQGLPWNDYLKKNKIFHSSPSGSSEGPPPRITNEKSYALLPKGSHYIDGRDGKEKVKQ